MTREEMWWQAYIGSCGLNCPEVAVGIADTALAEFDKRFGKTESGGDAEPEIVLPEPDANGDYQWPDGSCVYLSTSIKRWAAMVKGNPLGYDSALEAARELAKRGYGPGAKEGAK